jgi:hypothetical protein
MSLIAWACLRCQNKATKVPPHHLMGCALWHPWALFHLSHHCYPPTHFVRRGFNPSRGTQSRTVSKPPCTLTPPHAPFSKSVSPESQKGYKSPSCLRTNQAGCGTGHLFPAQSGVHSPPWPCSTLDIQAPGEELSHYSSEPQCPHPHNGAPLPRLSLLPRTMVQINELALLRDEPSRIQGWFFWLWPVCGR